MKIEFEDGVKKWIQSKGGQLMVKIIEVNVCCAPGVQELLTHIGKPKDIENFQEYKVDHLIIYVQKQIMLKDKLTLKLSGFGIFKSVSVKFV